MDIKEGIINLETGYAEKFKELKNNIFSLEFIVAERKAFLSTQKLMYKAKLKVYEDKKEVSFFEMLTDSASGFSSGSSDMDMSPGFGFKAEKTVYMSGRGREGTIAEQSILFGKKYQYSFDYDKIRKSVEGLASNYGYKFSVVLSERNL